MITCWLVVGPPLWNIWKSIGMISNPIYGKIKNGNQTTNQHGIWRIPPCPAWCQGCAVGSPGSLQNKWALQQQKCGLTSKGRRQLSCFTRGAQWPQSLRDRRCYIDVSTCLSFSNILILHHILPIYIISLSLFFVSHLLQWHFYAAAMANRSDGWLHPSSPSLVTPGKDCSRDFWVVSQRQSWRKQNINHGKTNHAACRKHRKPENINGKDIGCSFEPGELDQS